MNSGNSNKSTRPEFPFNGMLIFVIILFIVAMMIYKSWNNSSAAAGTGKSDANKSAFLSRDTTHRE